MSNTIVFKPNTMMQKSKESNINYIKINQEYFYKIENSDTLRPFFMSVVSDSDHWMFIASNGGLSAGRKNSNYALFPYYTDDKITEFAEFTGSKTIVKVTKNQKTALWEPFSLRNNPQFNITQNLYKNKLGNKIIFEEVNHSLNLVFKYEWNSSDRFGFVRKSYIENLDANDVLINTLDGIQNLMPYGVSSDLQRASSNLVDAYKRNELDSSSGLGVFALSAIIVDKAEPSEALKANVVWSLGLQNPTYLLSSKQLENFRRGIPVVAEKDIKAEKGAYFINKEFTLNANQSKRWLMVANVNQNHAAIVALAEQIKNNEQLEQEVLNDVEIGSQKLEQLIASSDGLQLTQDHNRNTRHLSNTLFNIMRGGIFDFNYQIEKNDFINYIAKANKKVAKNNESQLNNLPEVFSLSHLKNTAYTSQDKNFRRLCLEYMPLKFSRRHGDPSRPWNIFSINTKDEEGAKILDYEGNWRDIFQNWEALAFSFPEYIESMIHKFLNATTFDGYNPYRVTKDGFDWEVIEEHDPWSYIGYWGDHQIIYLLKFLEFIENYYPGKLNSFFNKDLFVYANVPYKIKPYKQILKNPKDTIEFDYELDEKLRQKKQELGADGYLLRDENQFICKVNFVEKILATLLAKMTNFIPEAGIWLNTQRPEWNDANNALVGNGVSMVTLYYLRRFINFFKNISTQSQQDKYEISEELVHYFNQVLQALSSNQNTLEGSFTDAQRKQFLDQIGIAASNYRTTIYDNAFTGNKEALSHNQLNSFFDLCLEYIDHTIKANKRPDHLYHAYNLMTVNKDNSISISYLSEMLEGQVAVLSAGYLSSTESLQVLDALKKSKLFREDQYSYLLYPNKELPSFLERNNIPEQAIKRSKLLQKLIDDNNTKIVEKDCLGKYHFNGNFNNERILKNALEALHNTKYESLVKEETNLIAEIFEEVFNHKSFTGRSGTFYGYEGLGSIYWHMVSKLQLAVLECCQKAISDQESDEVVGKMLEHYYEINAGIGVNKSAKLYGAFPTDPYSHTPAGKGAQQPGMTGQVKEDLLSRFGELGVTVKEGKLHFYPNLLRKNEEFLTNERNFNYFDVNNNKNSIPLEKDSLVFTCCQVPVIYKLDTTEKTTVFYNDGSENTFNQNIINVEESNKVFQRTFEIEKIVVSIPQKILK